MFKNRVVILFCIYLILPISAFTQGTSCATAIPLTLDGVLRIYPTSATTGSNVLCAANGTTPVTWFSFTTNAQAECPLMNITVSDSLACEVGFYTSCSSILTSSSMCFYDGYGLWAPNQNFTVPANTTYYLRVKTSTACNITIAAQHFTPPNDDCFGALTIDSAQIDDNNACDHPGPDVTPAQLCATTLENTAWYQFYVRDSGYSIINIKNIHCANGAANNSNGFQIGFFKGSCSALQWINCANGSGTFVQATTNILPAGTRVYVAIDGVAGSNCSYSISGFNTTGVLSGSLKYFSGWKTTKTNLLQWTALPDPGAYYIIERSLNGADFRPVGRVNNKGNGNTAVTYYFEDTHPPVNAFYRLRQIDMAGKDALSNIIYISRTGLTGLQVSIINPADNVLNLDAATEFQGQYDYRIINMQGQALIAGTKILNKGINRFTVNISTFPPGQYCFIIGNDKQRVNKMFIKNR